MATLRSISTEVRAAATKRSDAPELWLVVRDLEGLAGRLADLDGREWLDGFGATFVTGQDLGVLDELLTKDVALQRASVVSLTSQQATSLTRLREFLQRHRDGTYDSAEPAA